MQQFREVSRTKTIYSTETHTSEFIRSKMGSQCSFFPEEVLSGGDRVPREQVLQRSSEFSVEVG